MNKIIDAVKNHANDKPDGIAYKVFDELPGDEFSTDELTWRQLDTYSDRLAGYIKEHTRGSDPVIVYGHKDKLMIVCFMACVKSGHAYCAVDVSVPDNRVRDIVGGVNPEIILATEMLDVLIPTNCQIIGKGRISSIVEDPSYVIGNEAWLRPEDTFYLIFTSGSTGRPKGVQITTECLTNYVKWAKNLGGGVALLGINIAS